MFQLPKRTIFESKVAQTLESQGWSVFHTNSGFPDFFCVKEGKIRLIEAKSNDAVNKRQSAVFSNLEKAGYKPEVIFEWEVKAT